MDLACINITREFVKRLVNEPHPEFLNQCGWGEAQEFAFHEMVPQSVQGPNFEKDSSSIFSVQFSSVFTVTSQPPKVQIKRENEEIWGNMNPNPIKQKLQTQHLASNKNGSGFPGGLTPCTASHQAPPSMGLSRQEYWSGVPLPSPKQKPRRALTSETPPTSELGENLGNKHTSDIFVSSITFSQFHMNSNKTNIRVR